METQMTNSTFVVNQENQDNLMSVSQFNCSVNLVNSLGQTKRAVPLITLRLNPGLSSLSFRWPSGKDACDCTGGFRPWDEELDALPLHPNPQSFFLLRHQWAKSFQHRRPAAAWASQLLLKASLCQHHGGVWPGSRQVIIHRMVYLELV